MTNTPLNNLPPRVSAAAVVSAPAPPTERIPARSAAVTFADRTAHDNVYLLDRRFEQPRRSPLAPLTPPHCRSGEQGRACGPSSPVRGSEFFRIGPDLLLPRHVPRDLYNELEWRCLSDAQLARVPEFDITLQERTLEQLTRPVCCFSGNVAHVFAFDDLMEHWMVKRTNPFTGAELNRSDIFRVANVEAKASSTASMATFYAAKSNL